MGSFLSRARELTWNASCVDKLYDHGRPFVDMIKDHHLYGRRRVYVRTKYELKLVHNTCLPNVHWYILVRRKGVLTSPYVTIEIRTSNFTNVIPVMRNIVECNRHATDLGDVRMSLYDIYYLADEVFLEMRTYSIYATLL